MSRVARESRTQELEVRLEKADAALEEHQDRVAIMDEHLKNVQQELKYTQSRVRGTSMCAHTHAHTRARTDTQGYTHKLTCACVQCVVRVFYTG